MFCPTCGEKAAEADRYCWKCGGALGRSQDPGSESRPQPTTYRSRSFPWKWLGLLAVLVLVLGGIGIAIALNWSPEEKLGTVEAPRFDSSLAGGGLSSRELGTGLLVASLGSSEPIGYQILQDAIDENVIDNFAEVAASPGWTSEFQMNGSDFQLKFKNDRNYVIRYPPAQEAIADKIGTIGSRYGFLDPKAFDVLGPLLARTSDLFDAFRARQLTIGVAESDLASDASALVAEWDAWIQTYGGESPDVKVAQARRDVVSIVADVSANPTNEGIGEYNAAIDRLNEAIRDLKSGE